jgi:hypothetical protein
VLSFSLEEAKKHAPNSGYEVESIRWSGRSRFRAEAKAGDMIIEAFTEKRGARERVKVYEPRPIVHRQDHTKWTRFYVESPPDESYHKWKDIKADFESLGVINITPNSTRELTGKALGIQQLMAD